MTWRSSSRDRPWRGMLIRSSRVALLAWSDRLCVTRTRAHARDLTLTDLRALGLVKRGGPMRPGELARALQLSAGGTTGVILALMVGCLITAAALLTRPAPGVGAAVGLVALAPLVGYVLSRTTGLPDPMTTLATGATRSGSRRCGSRR
jgi:hypothetical protein